MKLTSPKRAVVCLAVADGGIEAFTIVSVILPVTTKSNAPPLIIPVLALDEIEVEPVSREYNPPICCLRLPLIVSVSAASVIVFFTLLPINSITPLPALRVIPVPSAFILAVGISTPKDLPFILIFPVPLKSRPLVATISNLPEIFSYLLPKIAV